MLNIKSQYLKSEILKFFPLYKLMKIIKYSKKFIDLLNMNDNSSLVGINVTGLIKLCVNSNSLLLLLCNSKVFRFLSKTSLSININF